MFRKTNKDNEDFDAISKHFKGKKDLLKRYALALSGFKKPDARARKQEEIREEKIAEKEKPFASLYQQRSKSEDAINKIIWEINKRIVAKLFPDIPEITKMNGVEVTLRNASIITDNELGSYTKSNGVLPFTGLDQVQLLPNLLAYLEKNKLLTHLQLYGETKMRKDGTIENPALKKLWDEYQIAFDNYSKINLLPLNHHRQIIAELNKKIWELNGCIVDTLQKWNDEYDYNVYTYAEIRLPAVEGLKPQELNAVEVVLQKKELVEKAGNYTKAIELPSCSDLNFELEPDKYSSAKKSIWHDHWLDGGLDIDYHIRFNFLPNLFTYFKKQEPEIFHASLENDPDLQNLMRRYDAELAIHQEINPQLRSCRTEIQEIYAKRIDKHMLIDVTPLIHRELLQLFEEEFIEQIQHIINLYDQAYLVASEITDEIKKRCPYNHIFIDKNPPEVYYIDSINRAIKIDVDNDLLNNLMQARRSNPNDVPSSQYEKVILSNFKKPTYIFEHIIAEKKEMLLSYMAKKNIRFFAYPLNKFYQDTKQVLSDNTMNALANIIAKAYLHPKPIQDLAQELTNCIKNSIKDRKHEINVKIKQRKLDRGFFNHSIEMINEMKKKDTQPIDSTFIEKLAKQAIEQAKLREELGPIICHYVDTMTHIQYVHRMLQPNSNIMAKIEETSLFLKNLNSDDDLADVKKLRTLLKECNIDLPEEKIRAIIVQQVECNLNQNKAEIEEKPDKPDAISEPISRNGLRAN